MYNTNFSKKTFTITPNLTVDNNVLKSNFKLNY